MEARLLISTLKDNQKHHPNITTTAQVTSLTLMVEAPSIAA